MNRYTKITVYITDGSSGSSPSGPLSCVTGTVNKELETGYVTYDDTESKECSFGQTQCYTQTIIAIVDKWPGMSFLGFRISRIHYIYFNTLGC